MTGLGQPSLRDPVLTNSAIVVVQSLRHVPFFATLWTVACQVPLSMGFSRQEYWNGLLFPPPGDVPDAGVELGSPALPGSVVKNPPANAGDVRDASR